MLNGLDKYIFDGIAQFVETFHEIHAVGIARLLEYARRDCSQYVAGLELIGKRHALAGRPRRHEQTQHADHHDQGNGKGHHRPHPGRQSHAGSEPHHHFTVSMPAGQCQQYA